MCIILLESPHARKTGQGAAVLISVQHSKVCQSQRQVTVGPRTILEHETVTWAVHGLQTKQLFFNLKMKHVVFVVVCMSAGDPEIKVEHVGCDHLIVLILPVLFSDVIHKCVVDASAMRQKKARARGKRVEEEELLLHTHIAMVALLGLLHAMLVLLELLLVWEGDGIYALQGLTLHIRTPEGTRNVGDANGLQVSRVWQMWPCAQIHHGSHSVQSNHGVSR
mmetsp:Transcript_9657/g.17055  ORF Transcript_9657/g.17055 Transcript_9657/m.17055 type:complete len:222 (+) Transcript_9657:1464-2129(+)